MSKLTKALTAAAGNAGESLYVEDVFSTYLYTGADANETVTNGIDLAGEGGLVWIKPRTTTGSHLLLDTERGTGKYLVSNSTAAEATYNPYLSSFNSDGFTTFAFAPADYASWTFREAEKFCSIVTWSGNGVARTIAHNLGSVPAMIIVKSTDGAGQNWRVYHTSLGATSGINLNDTGTSFGFAGWNNTAPTDSVFSVNTSGYSVNDNGFNYVAYLFASDAGGFGDDGSENIIKCGSFTTVANSATVVLGFEPQYLLTKKVDTADNWEVYDAMRGLNASGAVDAYLQPNTTSPEGSSNIFEIQSDGFVSKQATGNYIYIAIRRPMKTPEAGTEVFATDTRGSTGDGKAPTYRSPFPVDMQFNRNVNYAGGDTQISCRLTQAQQMFTNLTNAESANASMMFDYMNGVQTDTGTGVNQNAWMFKRATGVMDVVAYTGNGANSASPLTINHGLNSTPDMILAKQRTDAGTNWFVYHSSLGVNSFALLNLTNAAFGYNGGFDNITSTSFDVFDSNATNGKQFVAYLFATLAGVSKVGTYTGTGADLNVDCGFSAGARFILIKRTDSTGDWYYWDSLRGIVAGNDPYLLLNSTAAQVTTTDYIDPLSSGFTVTSTAPAALNASGGTYIFLAIA